MLADTGGHGWVLQGRMKSDLSNRDRSSLPVYGVTQFCDQHLALNRCVSRSQLKHLGPCQRGKKVASFHKTNASWQLAPGRMPPVGTALHLEGLPATRIGLCPPPTAHLSDSPRVPPKGRARACWKERNWSCGAGLACVQVPRDREPRSLDSLSHFFPRALQDSTDLGCLGTWRPLNDHASKGGQIRGSS